MPGSLEFLIKFAHLVTKISVNLSSSLVDNSNDDRVSTMLLMKRRLHAGNAVDVVDRLHAVVVEILLLLEDLGEVRVELHTEILEVYRLSAGKSLSELSLENI